MEDQKNFSFFRRIFQGRLSRKPFFLANLVVIVGLSILGAAMVSSLGEEELTNLMAFLGLLLLLITYPITVRRLHDTGNSGWVALIATIIFPLSGGILTLIYSLYLFIWPGKSEPNKYGPPEVGNRRFLDAIFNRGS
ncbi:MAG: DUF805 domain-containing protein [Candidatus Moraniibacteriota bacterium]